MNALKISLCLLLIIALRHNILGQVLELDLASILPGEVKVISENKNISYTSILLINIVPARAQEYKVRYEIETKLPDPLPTDFRIEEDQFSLCSVLIQKLAAVRVNTSLKEQDVPETIKELELDVNNCKVIVENNNSLSIEQRSAYKDYIKNVEITLGKLFKREVKLPVGVNTGEIGKIIVSRGDLEWTFVLKGRQLGQWVITYGFGFTSQATESQTYFTKQIPDTTIFQILKSRRAKIWDLNYVPAIFFSYFPLQNFNRCWNNSLTAGIGSDLSAPVVFFGYNGMYYHNIGLSIGIAFQQQYKLKEQYSEFERVSISLERGQLHDQVYRPNLFIAINFRFGENPFKSKNE